MKYSVLTFTLIINAFLFSCITKGSDNRETHFMYAPGRSKQIPRQTQDSTKISCCRLCKAVEEHNPSEFPLLRTDHFTVLLNLFPYGQGHLLIVANEHIKALDQLTVEQKIELISLISESTTILKKEFKCHGINVGYNEGRCAGASVVDHFHMHVLPRFEFFEKSFAQAISNLQVVQWDFKELQQRLKPYFDTMPECRDDLS